MRVLARICGVCGCDCLPAIVAQVLVVQHKGENADVRLLSQPAALSLLVHLFALVDVAVELVNAWLMRLEVVREVALARNLLCCVAGSSCQLDGPQEGEEMAVATMAALGLEMA